MNRKQVIGVSVVLVTAAILLKSCKTIPKGAVAVKPFDINRYLGKWYEVARFDYRFEKNLINTTAEYSLKDNGNIKVVNRGYDVIKGKWKEAEGKAKFAGDKDEAKLKVSFFGPFYAGYNVIAIDPGYQYALVAGKNLNYLWILSREKTIPASIKESYLQKARALGYNTNELNWVKQE